MERCNLYVCMVSAKLSLRAKSLRGIRWLSETLYTSPCFGHYFNHASSDADYQYKTSEFLNYWAFRDASVFSRYSRGICPREHAHIYGITYGGRFRFRPTIAEENYGDPAYRGLAKNDVRCSLLMPILFLCLHSPFREADFQPATNKR